MKLSLLEIETFAMLYHRQDRTVMECGPHTGYGASRDRLVRLGLVTQTGRPTNLGKEFARRLRRTVVPEPKRVSTP